MENIALPLHLSYNFELRGIDLATLELNVNFSKQENCKQTNSLTKLNKKDNLNNNYIWKEKIIGGLCKKKWA